MSAGPGSSRASTRTIEPLENFSLGGGKAWIVSPILCCEAGEGYPIKANGEHKFKFKGNWKIQLENTTGQQSLPEVNS